MLDQFNNIKREHPDSILFYRMGDFYELFFDDAKVASEVLGIRLTKRAHGKATSVPLAGFPHHQIDKYLTKMVKANYKVVVVEQVEDPKNAKGLVKRDVVQIATAGTNPAIIDDDSVKSTRIAALISGKGNWGFAWADIGSGEFFAGEFEKEALKNLAASINPVELLLPESRIETGTSLFSNKGQVVMSKIEDWIWECSFARQTLISHFGTLGLKGFGMDGLENAISAAGALLHYLKGNLRSNIDHFTKLSRADISDRLIIDSSSIRNLEITESLTGAHHATLFSVVNRTVTSSGKRLLYNRLVSPLTDLKKINFRLQAVEELIDDSEIRAELRIRLKKSGDIQRILARIATNRGSGRDLVGVRELLETLPEYQKSLSRFKSTILKDLMKQIEVLPEINELLQNALGDEQPLGISEGGMIREGFNSEIDELRLISQKGRSWLTDYENSQRKRTGIPKLKVGYNRVFGYYIEVSKLNIEKIPEDFIRRQTLVSAERYTTEALQNYEDKLLGAEEKSHLLEKELFQELCQKVMRFSIELQLNGCILAELDFLSSLAELAEEENFVKPELNNSEEIILMGSRHPVVEKLLPPGEVFIPNDLLIGGLEERILIITGPNMAGKSTYLRQVALIVILAQMGSFVPAEKAEIGVVDKLFTRIGALDNLAGGESTFLVEMQETASILNNTTSRSLVIFDEVGRGTSTFDGLSIAWSIIEYLHEQEKLNPRTLFATHFHEMVDLEKHLKHVGNRNVSVREYGEKVIFLRKIVPGGSDRSFGIHVAQMAGLPKEVIMRAREVLKNLEANELYLNSKEGEAQPEKGFEDKTNLKVASIKSQKRETLPTTKSAQLTFFDLTERKLREMLIEVDPDNLTPMQALQLIAELKSILG